LTTAGPDNAPLEASFAMGYLRAASVKFAAYSLCETAARVGLDARKNVKEFLYTIAFEN
jgi:hypothetical protein